MPLLSRRSFHVLLLLGALLACKRSSSDKDVTATDGRSAMRVPGDWSTETDLNEKADLQVGNRAKQQFVIVLTEAKEDFQSMDPARLLEHHVANLERGMGSPVRSALPTTTLGAYPARQMELQGSVNNVNIAYLITAVEGPKYFHGIIAWTTKSRWTETKPIFEKTLPSFREL